MKKKHNPDINWGSEQFFHPVNTTLNGSYDILRNGTLESKNIKNISYRNSLENIYYNITNPLKNIKSFGVNKFIELEIFNLSFNPAKGHFLPNIANHVLGNGMLYVKLEEWFHYNQYNNPKIMSMLTTTFYQVMNEVVEHPTGEKYINVDSIADLLIFNPIGILLFNFESVKKYFSYTAPIQDWSLQPMYNPFTNELENTGQNYIMHLPVLKSNRIKPFIYWGIHGIAGLSYTKRNNQLISIGLGRVVNRIHGEIRETSYLENTIFFTPDMDGSFSVFLSDKKSLLMSAMITGPRFYNLQINIYPGIIKLGGFSPGFYCAIGESEGLVIGLSFNSVPFGLGKNFIKI